MAPAENVEWHPPLRYRYSYRTHNGHAMLLAPEGGYPRRWIRGPRLAGIKRFTTPENVEEP